MALPELPEGFFWSVQKIPGIDRLLVSLYAEDAQPGSVSLGEREVVIRPFEGEGSIVGAVESAANTIWSGIRRDIWIEDVIKRNWPLCPQ